MCFSATASFAAGIVLTPASAFCVIESLRKRPQTFLMSLVPAAFALQQLSEGFVWYALDHGDQELARTAGLVFLFFALAFWPFWFCLLSALNDPRTRARQAFTILAIAASSWFWVLFFPLLTDSGSLLAIKINHHSIYYDVSALPINEIVPRTLMRILYFACVVLPMACGHERLGRLPGLVLAGMVIVTALVYDYAFVSVWCFFAAWLSLYLCIYFWKMPKPTPDETSATEAAF